MCLKKENQTVRGKKRIVIYRRDSLFRKQNVWFYLTVGIQSFSAYRRTNLWGYFLQQTECNLEIQEEPIYVMLMPWSEAQ